jgi:hypothetical protein
MDAGCVQTTAAQLIEPVAKSPAAHEGWSPLSS